MKSTDIENELLQVEDDIKHELDKFFEHPVDPELLINKRNSLSELLDELINKHALGRTR